MGKLTKQSRPETTAKAVVLIRLMVGGIFLVEGILKFLYPGELGAGRFAKIGFPHPELLGPVAALCESAGGAAIMLGLFTRVAAIPLLCVISVAIVSTKVPVLLGHSFWGFALPKAPHYGILGMVHEGRADFCMWLGLMFLLMVGSGRWSIDGSFGSASEKKGKPKGD